MCLAFRGNVCVALWSLHSNGEVLVEFSLAFDSHSNLATIILKRSQS